MGDRDEVLEALSCVNELEEAVEFIEMTDEDLEPIPLEHWLSKTRNIRQALERQRVPEWPKRTSAMERAGVRALLDSDATSDQQLVWEVFEGMLAAAPEANDG